MDLKEARGIADEALRTIATNPDFHNVKDLIGGELDITDEVLDEAVEALFNRPCDIVLDAKKYEIWMNGLAAAPKAPDFYAQYKTLWDIPLSYLPEHVFAAGFETAKQYLPAEGAGVWQSI